MMPTQFFLDYHLTLLYTLIFIIETQEYWLIIFLINGIGQFALTRYRRKILVTNR